jgi:hypothetical protein
MMEAMLVRRRHATASAFSSIKVAMNWPAEPLLPAIGESATGKSTGGSPPDRYRVRAAIFVPIQLECPT